MTERARQPHLQTPIVEEYALPIEELPNSPVIPLEETYRELENLLGPEEPARIASAIVNFHKETFGNIAQKQIEVIKRQEPEANIVAEGWKARLRGNPGGLSFDGMNYMVILEPPHIELTIAQRAAGLIYAAANLYTQMDNPTLLRALDEGKLMETRGYKKIFGSMRIPGQKADNVHHTETSDHIVVTCSNGGMYKLQVLRYGLPIPQEELEVSINKILELDKEISQKESIPSENSRFSLRRSPTKSSNVNTESIAPLTWLPRRIWYNVRKRLSKNPNNAKSFELYDNALFTLSLDTESSPETLEEVAQLTQYGCIKKRNGTSGPVNMNTMTEAGINFVVYANGHAGAKAEHLITDGNIFSRVINSINKTARKLAMESAVDLMPSPSKYFRPQSIVERINWEIPEDPIIEARKYYDQEMKKRNCAYVMIEGIGANELGRGMVDACMQIAIQCAFTDVRMQLDNTRTKPWSKVFKKALDFVTLEPTRARGYKGGRLTNASTSTPEVRDYIRQITQNHDRETDKSKLIKAIESVKKAVLRASEGKSYTSQLMGQIAVLFRRNPEEAAVNLNRLEKLFINMHPAIKKVIRPELLGSSGGRSDQADATAGFCTVDPLGSDGITVGYMPGTLGKPTKVIVRAKGKYRDSCYFMAEQVEYHLRNMYKILHPDKK